MEKIDKEIKRLEAKMTELRKIMGVMYTQEMYEIDNRLRELHRNKKDDKF